MKSAKLDQEFEDLASQKERAREEAKKAMTEMELKLAEREKTLERDFMLKLQQVEIELLKSSEESKEACIASVYR